MEIDTVALRLDWQSFVLTLYVSTLLFGWSNFGAWWEQCYWHQITLQLLQLVKLKSWDGVLVEHRDSLFWIKLKFWPYWCWDSLKKCLVVLSVKEWLLEMIHLLWHKFLLIKTWRCCWYNWIWTLMEWKCVQVDMHLSQVWNEQHKNGLNFKDIKRDVW